MRIILHGKAAGDARVRTAVFALRQNGHPAEVRVTWEPGDAARLTADAMADAGAGKVGCIVAGGGDGTINEVFATAYGAGLPEQCSLGAWIEYESENDLNVNLDGEPMLVKQFRVECRQRVLPVHLGDSPLISSH